MAVGTGMGFDLSGLEQAIKKADDNLKKLEETNKNVVKRISSSWKEIGEQGLDSYLLSLEKQKKVLNDIASIRFDDKTPEALKKYGENASESIDQLNTLIETLKQLQNQRAMTQYPNQLLSGNTDYWNWEKQQLEDDLVAYRKNKEEKAKADKEEYEARRKQLQETFDAEERYNKSKLANATALAKSYERELAERKRAQEEILRNERNIREFTEKGVKSRTDEANRKAQGEHDANQKAFQEALKIQQQALERFARNEHEKREEIKRTREAGLEAAQALDKAQAKNESLNRAKNYQRIQRYGDTSSQALAAYDRLVSGKGQLSVNNMQDVLSKLEKAQNKINLKTSEGRERYNELEAAIRKVKSTIDSVVDAAEKQQKAIDNASGDSLKGAWNYYKRLYSDKGVKSINNMYTALQKLRDAQSNLNLNTDDGRKKYRKLGDAIKRIEKDMANLRRQSKNVNNEHSELLDIGSQLQRKLALIFSVSQITGYMNKLVAVRKEFEMQQKSLQILLRDKASADELWQKTVDLAVKSPFRIKELITYTKQLAAYRIESGKLHDTTKRLADISAGLGVDMQRLILAYGQVKAASFLRGTELRQFTEAGIPMLEELAEYFSEIEGRAVSVGDVFERISKRLVSFSHVEAVINKMTDAGGIFYNMQEEQSRTLAGMISNWHDSVDIMLNDIGKSQDGVLKDMVTTAKILVENWRAVAAVLKMVGTSIAFIQIKQFAIGWNAVATAGVAAATSMDGVAGAAARLNVGMKSLWATLAAHPILLIVGALSAAGYAMWEYSDAIKAANEKYDEASRKEVSRIHDLQRLNEEVEKNNKAIKENAKSNKENADAVKSNNRVLAEIKRKYPEMYAAIVKQKDGTIEMTKALEEQNKVLRTNILLQQAAKGGFFQDDLSQNYKQVVDRQEEIEIALKNVRVAAQEAGTELEEALNKGTIKKEEYESLKKYLLAFSEATDRKSMLSAQYDLEDYRKNTEGMISKTVKMFSFLNLSVFKYFKEFRGDWFGIVKSYDQLLEDLYDNINGALGVIKLELSEIQDVTQRGIRLDEMLTDLGIADKQIKSFVKERIVKDIGIEVNLKGEGNKEYTIADLKEEWRKKLWTALEEVKDASSNEVQFGVTIESLVKTEDKDAFIKQLSETVKEYQQSISEIKEMPNEGKDQIKYTQEQIKAYKDAEEPLKKLAELLNIVNKENNSGGGNEALERLKEQIRIVRELAKDYQKLWEEQGKVIADEKIWSEERKSAFSKVGLDYSQFNVGEEGDEVNNLRKLTDIAGDLDKAIADASTELGSFKQQLSDAEFARYIEDLFGNYEVSLELSKLNIPQDMAKRLFGIDSIDLDDIRAEILNKVGLSNIQGSTNEEILNSENYLKLNKEQRKIVEDGLKKVEELEQKALQERLKRYSQFLIKGQSERVRIKLEELRELEKLEEDYNNKRIEETDYKLAQQGIKSESKEKLDKLEWDEFQNSSLYIQMFEDLETVSTSALNKMREKLIEMRESLSELDPSDLKAINEQIEKIDEEAVKRNPIKGLATSLKGYIKYLKERKELERQIQEQRVKEENAEKNVKSAELDAAEKQVEYEKVSKSKQASREEVQNAFMAYRHSQNMLIATKDRLKSEKKVTKELEEQQKKLAKDEKTFKESAFEVGSYSSQSANASPQIAGNLEQVFGTFDDETKDAVESIAEISSGIGNAIQGFASGDFVGGIVGATDAIAGIFAIGDKKKEREIKKQQRLIEELGKQYEKLEEQIEKAYTVNDLKSSFDESMKNLEEQIAAREKMIAAEEDKKKTDNERIKQWQEEIAEIEKQKTEILQSQVEELGGTYDFKSAAREFVDAWLDAFNESGNGLKGFEKQFNDFYMNIVRNQAVTRGASKILEPMLQEIDKALEGDFMVDKSENSKIQKAADYAGEQFNNFMMQMIENWGNSLTGQSNVELSGLQRGIQGVTEDTAEILASYLNSIRFFVSEQSDLLKQLVALQNGNNQTENPMVAQLKLVVRETTTIKEAIQSVIQANHKNGGSGIRVFID